MINEELVNEVIKCVGLNIDAKIHIDIKDKTTSFNVDRQGDMYLHYTSDFITSKLDMVVERYIEKLYNKAGIEVNALSKELFIILHELGHAYDYVVNYNKDNIKFYKTYRKGDVMQNRIWRKSLKNKGIDLSDDDRYRLYAELNVLEVEANRYAMYHIGKVVKYIDSKYTSIVA